MNNMRLLKALGCAVIVSFLLSAAALADIAVGPLTKTIEAAPGGAQTLIYKVANNADKPVNINVSAKTWFSLPENAAIDIGQWLKLGVEKLTLAPKEEKELKFEVVVPKQAKGELASMIYFTPEREEGQMLGTSYGVSLYVFVKGTEVVNPQIGAVSLSKKDGIFYIAVTIENKGNVHFRPRVNAIIKIGKDIKENIVLPFGKPIFGGQDYNFVQKIEKQLPSEGDCEIEILCNYGNSADTIIKKSQAFNLGEVKE